MTIKNQLKQLCKEVGDIQITSIDLENMSVDVLFPFDPAEVTVELEGNDDDEIIESFKDGVNKRLDEMINHLEDCKF